MKNETVGWTGDRDYHSRHTRRSLSRARCIARHISNGGSFLDVGCNRGITAKHLLDAGSVASVTGVELAKDAVARELLLKSSFRLIQGDICDIELEERHDNIFYGAVHHHIVRERGFKSAIEVLRMLVQNCNESLYFETGHITEGGRWAWQNCLREFFRTDEEHIFYLLQTVEPWVRDFSIVGKFYIHGVRRWLIRIEVGRKEVPRQRLPASVATLGSVLGKGIRTTRSAGVEPLAAPNRLSSLAGNEYYIERTNLSTTSFFKRRAAMEHIDADEFHIGSQIVHDWAVRPIGLDSSTGIEFPFIAGVSLLTWKGTTPGERDIVCMQVRKIFREASRARITPMPRTLLPAQSGISLLQLIDLNPKNLMVVEGAGRPVVRVVDFERQSNHYLWKNRIHLARSLFRLRRQQPYAAYQLCVGVLGSVYYLLRYQFADVRQRIVDRQPSMASFVLAETRSALGRVVVKLFPFLKEL